MRRSMSVSLLAAMLSSASLMIPAPGDAALLDQGEIRFQPGTSSATLSGSIAYEDNAVYSLVSSAGQWMDVSIRSARDNAFFVLSIYSYGTGDEVRLEGAGDGQTARHWQGRLPKPGYSKDGTQNVISVMVGSTGGEALYDLSISIHDQPLKVETAPLLQRASVNGKYHQLRQTLTCPQDRAQYGEFADYGYWGGGPWCGQSGQAGYWVWVPPTWYIWADKSAGAR